MNGIRASRITTYSELNRFQRQRSGSQTNLAEGNDRRQTYGGLRRSSSSSHLRTPAIRQASRSPGSKTPTVTAVVSTSEQYRRLAPDNTVKVMQMLQSNKAFFSKLNLGNTGLKSMTSNQFVEIVSFFMLKISGKNLISKTRLKNVDDIIANFIQTLKYPFAVNTASFKNPNSHQSFPEVAAILAFFCDLVHDMQQYGVPTDMPLTHCDRLVNDEFTKLLAAEALDNYSTYDPDQGLDPVVLDKLVNRMLSIKMKFDGLTFETLLEKAALLRQSSAELKQNLVETDCEKYFNNIEEQFLAKEMEYEKLEEILREKRKCLKIINFSHDEKSRELAAMKTKLDEVSCSVRDQKYTTLDIKQLAAKETSVKNSIVMIQSEVDAIKLEAGDAQVKMARLQKLKLDAIKEFNDLTFRITQQLMQCRSFQQLNINDLTIDPTAPAKAIEHTCLRLQKLADTCDTIKRATRDHNQQKQLQLAECEQQRSQLDEKYTVEMTKFQQANQHLQNIHRKLTECEGKRTENTAKLQNTITDCIARKKQIDAEIEHLHKKHDRIQAKNEELLQTGESQARDILIAKQRLSDRIDELNDLLDDM